MDLFGSIGRCSMFLVRRSETAWNGRRMRDCWGLMGNSQGRDNAKKRAARRKKTERLALAKDKKKREK